LSFAWILYSLRRFLVALRHSSRHAAEQAQRARPGVQHEPAERNGTSELEVCRLVVTFNPKSYHKMSTFRSSSQLFNSPAGLNSIQGSKSSGNIQQQLQIAQHNRQIMQQIQQQQQQQQQRLLLSSGAHPLQMGSGLTLHQSSHMPLVNSPSSGNILNVRRRYSYAARMSSPSLRVFTFSNHHRASNLLPIPSSINLSTTHRSTTATLSSTTPCSSHYRSSARSH
jgi:hypothetical protein